MPAKKRSAPRYTPRTVYVSDKALEDLFEAAMNDMPITKFQYWLYPDDDLNEMEILFTPTQAKKLDNAANTVHKALNFPASKRVSKAHADAIAVGLLAQDEELMAELEAEDLGGVVDIIEEAEEEGLNDEELAAAIEEFLKEEEEEELQDLGLDLDLDLDDDEEFAGVADLFDIEGTGVVKSLKKIGRGRNQKAVSNFSKAQLKQMKGSGVFADVGKFLTGAVSEVANTFVPGLGTLLKNPVDAAIEEIDKAITGKGMMSKKELKAIQDLLKKQKSPPKKKASKGGRVQKKRRTTTVAGGRVRRRPRTRRAQPRKSQIQI